MKEQETYQENEENSVRIPAGMLWETSLNPMAKILLAFLMNKPNDWKFTQSRQRLLWRDGKRNGYNGNAIKVATAQLEEAGLLSHRSFLSHGKPQCIYTVAPRWRIYQYFAQRKPEQPMGEEN